MKKIIASSVLASALLFPTFANAENASFPVNMTAEKKVDIRSGATSWYSIVKSLNIGQKVTVIDEFVNSSGETWYRVDLGNAKGWGLSTQFSQSGSTPTSDYATVNNSNVNIRKGATTLYPIVGILQSGMKVKIIDTIKNSQSEIWYRIDSQGKIGWVSGKYLSLGSSSTSPQTDQKTVMTTAVVRKGATTSYSSVGTLAKNQTVDILDIFTNNQSEKWFRIKSGNLIGWVISTVFDTVPSVPDPQPQPEQPANPVQINKYVYALKNAVIRRGASSNYAVTSSLNANEKLFATQELNGWLNVKTTTGKSGWILQSQTTQFSSKSLVSPTTYKDGENSYLVWQKPINFSFTYSVNSANQLTLTNGITDVELPSFNVKGIKSVDTVQTSGGQKSVILTFEPGYTFTLRDYQNKVSIKVLPTGLLGKKIIIDPGHGGKDTGAIGPTGLREKDANLGTALLVKSELEKAGAIVTLTRATDIFLELSERTDIANLSDADAFISIHSDSYSTTSTGTTTYFNSTVNFNGPRSRQLGQSVQQNLIDNLSTYNRGVKEQEFYVNRMNELPSILVEMAYISNPKEESLLRSNDFRQKVAIGITQGLQAYFTNF
jgi:N-acetylmuramoyl-L-alanine amidase